MRKNILSQVTLEAYRSSNHRRHFHHRDAPDLRLSAQQVIKDESAIAVGSAVRGEMNRHLVKVSVDRGDGLSWTSQQLWDAVEKTLPGWHRHAFSGTGRDLPEILESIGPRDALRAFSKAGLPVIDRFARILLNAAIAASVAWTVSVLYVYFQNGLQNTSNYYSSPYVVLSLIGLLSLTAGYLIRSTPPLKKIPTILADLHREAVKDPDCLHRVARSLAEVVCSHTPTVLVVDEYGNLDRLTHSVLLAALLGTSGGAGLLFVVSVESSDDSVLEKELAVSPKPRHFRVRELAVHRFADDELRSIAESQGLPLEDAEDYVLVAAMVRASTAHGVSRGQESHDTEYSDDELATIYYLGHLAAPTRPSVRVRQVISEIAGEDTAFTRICRRQEERMRRAEALDLLSSLHKKLSGAQIVISEPSSIVILSWTDLLDIEGRVSRETRSRIQLAVFLYLCRRGEILNQGVRDQQTMANWICQGVPHLPSLPSGLQEEVLRFVGSLLSETLGSTDFASAAKLALSLLEGIDWDSEFLRGLPVLRRQLFFGCWSVFLVTGSDSLLNSLVTTLTAISTTETGRAGSAEIPRDSIDFLSVLGVPRKLAVQGLAAKERLGGPDQNLHGALVVYFALRWRRLLRLLGGDVPVDRGSEDLVDELEKIVSDADFAATAFDLRLLRHIFGEMLFLEHMKSAAGDLADSSFFLPYLWEWPTTERADEDHGDPRGTLLERALLLQECRLLVTTAVRARVGDQSSPFSFPLGEGRRPTYATNLAVGRTGAKEFSEICTLVSSISGVDCREPIDANGVLTPRFLHSVEDLCLNDAYVWEKLGLRERRDSEFLASAEYIGDVSNLRDRPLEHYEFLIGRLAGPLSSETLTGIEANWFVANALKRVQDLAAPYFLEVACRLWETECPLALAVAVGALSMPYAKVVNTRNCSRLAYSIVSRADREAEVETELQYCSLGDLMVVVDFCLQTALLQRDDSLFQRSVGFAEMISNVLRRNGNAAETIHLDASVLSCVSANEMRTIESFDSGRVNQILEKVPSDTTRMWLLTFLPISAKRDLGFVRTAAEALLRRGRNWDQHMVRVSRDILYAGQELECEEILNRVIEDARVCGMRIVEECDLTLAQDFLQLMRMFDVEHFGLYSEKHKLISKVNLQRARIESFQSLIDDGQYFVTLLQYWKMLRFLDEALFGRLDDLGGALGADEWRRWGLSHPEEVDWVVRLGGDGRYRVNSAFFCFGESMLRMDAFEEETPDVMSRMNSMAAGSLDSFFAACEVAEGIPGPIRSILKDHRGLFG